MTSKLVCVCDYCHAQGDINVRDDLPSGWIRLKREGMYARGTFDICDKCVEGDPMLTQLYLMSEQPRPREVYSNTTTDGRKME